MSDFWIEFTTHRDGKLIRSHAEEGHSWVNSANDFFYSMFFGTVRSDTYVAAADQKDRGIVIGSEDTPFNASQTSLASLINISTVNYHEQIRTVTYNETPARWELSLARSFYNLSAHLGGVDVTVKELGIIGNVGVFNNFTSRLTLLARDVLETPQLIEPLDTFTITYKIYVNIAVTV